MSDLLSNVIAYEAGQLDDHQTVEFLGELLRSGLVWHLRAPTAGRRSGWSLRAS